MAPQSKMEFTVLKLYFAPERLNKCDKIEFRYPTHSLSATKSSQAHWFNRKVKEEVRKVPLDLFVTFIEWEVYTSNPDFFTIGDNTLPYDKVLLLIGEEYVHWTYYENKLPFRRSEGTNRLNFNFCGCCMHTQYKDVMDKIKNFVVKKMSKQS